MTIEQLVPDARSLSEAELCSALEAQRDTTFEPFGAAAQAFAAALANALFHDRTAVQHPELVALAYWMRPAEVSRLRATFEAAQDPTLLLTPRGLVLHFAPGNVDTIFIYSWLLSLLCGNRNVIRVSQRDTPMIDILLGHVRTALQRPELEDVRRTTWIMRFGHDDAISGALSRLCDVRVIWGGDETVTHLRSLPLSPHAREVTFPDRFGFAALKAAEVAALGDDALRGLAERFYNDAYVFDQMACASPRLVVWTGRESEATAASERLFGALARVIAEKGYQVATAVALGKLTFGYTAAADRSVRRVRRINNELLLLELGNLRDFDRTHCGGGAFFEARVDRLADLVPFVRQKDQSMTTFGFAHAELRELARKVAGRGIKHMVPVGQALAFHRFWDGMDLLGEMLERVYIPTTPAAKEPAP